jgi:rhomboid family GlyGly-CTERM serine protease
MTMDDDSKCLLPPQNMQRRNLLASLNCDGHLGFALLACLALPWLLWAGGPSWTAALRYERVALHNGEWWRLISAHWVHLGAWHLMLDSAGLALLWALYARELRPLAWLLIALGATATIDAGLWWAQPQLQWYEGLSGLLDGAGAAGAAAAGLRQGRWAWLMLALLALKLALEQRTGASVVTGEFPVVTIAHVYGAIGGLGAYAILALARKPL